MSKMPSFDSELNDTSLIGLSFSEVVSQFTAKGVIHIWIVDKTKIKEDISIYSKLLSKEELTKTQKFRFEKDRSTFILARGVLRLLLSSYKKTKPNNIVFEYGTFGKPSLKGDHDIKFNVSHSKELIVLAFSRSTEIGVDVEYLNSSLNLMDVATTVFSEKEIDFLKSLPDQDRVEGFFFLWTRKEAMIKFLGYGLSMPVSLPTISVLRNQVDPPNKDSGFKGTLNLKCKLRSFIPEHGYCVALASEDLPISFALLDWKNYRYGTFS